MNKQTPNQNNFSINTNSGIISYNKKGIDKLQKNDNIIINTNDPIGNHVVLWQSTFEYHILAEHYGNDSRHYLDNERNIDRIIKAINNPRFILEDKKEKNRLEFLSLTDIISGGEIRLKGLSIITEESDSINNSYEIVTVIPKSRISMNITNRRVVYDVNNNSYRT